MLTNATIRGIIYYTNSCIFMDNTKMNSKKLVESNKLVKMYAGSIAYGTNLPASDVDFRGIFCGNPVNVRTPFFPIREWGDSSEEDTKYFELAHFMKLALDCNPNIVELLWTNDSDIVFRTPAYDILRDNRHALLSSKIAFTTSGYALSQLSRIKNHNRWISWNDPLNKLYKILSTAYENNDIDKEFIERNCGKDILYYMEKNKYIV